MLNTARNIISSKERVRLENYLRTRAPVTTNSAPSIPRRGAGKNVPLTAVQQQIWVHAQMAPDLPLYNEPVTIHYSGPLDYVAFERAFNEILRRHEAWRTSFNVVNGGPIQIDLSPALRRVYGTSPGASDENTANRKLADSKIIDAEVVDGSESK